jgi:hypothetical protein
VSVSCFVCGVQNFESFFIIRDFSITITDA